MIGRVAPHSEPLVIGAAVCAAAFGVVVWFAERRKHRFAALNVLLGVPGVYLGFLTSLGAPKWLYIPCVTMLASSAFLQLVIEPRLRRRGQASPPQTSARPRGRA